MRELANVVKDDFLPTPYCLIYGGTTDLLSAIYRHIDGGTTEISVAKKSNLP